VLTVLSRVHGGGPLFQRPPVADRHLSERAGISRRTLQKIERGDPKCETGLVFEVANIVGVKLFSDEENSIRYTFGRHIGEKLALLPKRVRRSVKINDDF